ncbi:hypothetical protein U1707_15835 [Sphingomonas sp. PB2P12]
MTYTNGYRAIRQRWTIAFGVQLRSRGKLVTPFGLVAGPNEVKPTRVVFT